MTKKLYKDKIEDNEVAEWVGKLLEDNNLIKAITCKKKCNPQGFPKTLALLANRFRKCRDIFSIIVKEIP